MRIRLTQGFWSTPRGLLILKSVLGLFAFSAVLFVSFYVHYSRMIDQRLSGEAMENTARVFTGPRTISAGQPATAGDLVSYLQRAGYSEPNGGSTIGSYRQVRSSIEVRPGKDSYFSSATPLRVDFSGSTISRISGLADGKSYTDAELEPEPLTNLSGDSREKSRSVRFEDLPKYLVDAVLSAEDKRFFEHPGFDPIRVLGAAWSNVKRSDRTEGASTISMQVARSYFFTTERTWRRKVAETFVALQLEHRFNKQQIFELYANKIYLGHRGSFAIRGFGEAARAYFDKDVRDLSLAESAFLAGIARSPNRYSTSERHLERASEARDRVLTQMVENNQVSPEAADAAKKAPWHIISGTLETSSAPYFVDMVKDHLLDKMSEADLNSQNYRIYTTLDVDVQRAAAQAVDVGIREVDKQLAARYARWRKQPAKAGEIPPVAQVALVALDPRTGEVKALIGGRNYGQSQLNRALARRQPGSAFKPFVYAAAFDSAISGGSAVITPATTVVDEPTTFHFDGKDYTPNNYGEQFYGTVTLRDALKRSLNVATVKVAEMIGYGRVMSMAQQLGLDPNIRATPAVALGAYEMTPLDVAAGYTVFATGGVRAEPMFIHSVISGDGKVFESSVPRTRQALDPRTSYMVTNLLEDVINHGTAAGVRSRGFYAPAGGKTGTSHDGWFAGFTSNLVTVVWVGFDDNRELNLAGSASAAPIWAEFMKRVIALPAYRDARDFPRPGGVVTALIDPETGQLATPDCLGSREEIFIEGTQPTVYCEKHGGRERAESAEGGSWLSRIFGGRKKEPETTEEQETEETTAEAAAPEEAKAGDPSATEPVKRPVKKVRRAKAPAKDSSSQQPAPPPEQKSLWQRFLGIFGKGNQPPPKPPEQPAQQNKKPPPRPARQ